VTGVTVAARALGVHNGGLAIDRAVPAFDIARFHPQVNGADLSGSRGGCSVVVLLRAEVVIDMKGIDLVLLVHSGFSGASSRVL